MAPSALLKRGSLPLSKLDEPKDSVPQLSVRIKTLDGLRLIFRRLRPAKHPEQR